MSETIINSIVTLTIGVISALVSIKISNNTTKREIRYFKEQETYKIKKDAIYETLQFFDDYISCLTIDNGTIQSIRNDVNSKDLTIKARICYNKLCTTCNNETLIKKFNQIVFGHDDNIFCLLNEFRNSAREELGLNKIDLDENEVFICRVSTNELRREEQNNNGIHRSQIWKFNNRVIENDFGYF